MFTDDNTFSDYIALSNIPIAPSESPFSLFYRFMDAKIFRLTTEIHQSIFLSC